MAKRYDLGSVIGKIIFNYDTKGTDDAKKGLDDTDNKSKNFTKNLDKSSDKAFKDLTKIAKGFAIVAASATAISGGANLIVGLATEISHLSGVIGLLPAGAIAGAAAIGTLTLGMEGFGQAISDAGDPAKFAADLKNLAPNAQSTAKAFQSLRGQLINLKMDVQNKLFMGTSTIVKDLGNKYIPVVRNGLGDMALALNHSVQEWAMFAKQSSTVNDLKGMLGNSSKAVDVLSGAVKPLASALTSVGAVGSTFLPELAKEATALATQFGDFVKQARASGQLKKWIQGGLDAMKQLFQIIGNIVGIATKLFGGLATGGAGLFNTLQKVTGQLNAFLSTAAAQKTLKQLGDTLSAISTVVTQVLLKALQQLGPILQTALPPFKQLVQSVGPLLIGFLNIVGPLLQHLAQFWADNASVINPLLLVLAGLITAFKGISGVIGTANKIVNGFKDAVDLLQGIGKITVAVGKFFLDMSATIGRSIGTAILWVGRFVITMAQVAINVAASALNIVTSIGRMVAGMIVSIGQWIAAQAAALIENAIQWATTMAEYAVVVASYIAGWVAMAAEAVADAAIMAAAWIAANPWVLIIAAIAIVIAYIITHWTQIKNFFVGVWNDIKNGVVTAWNAIGNWISDKIDDIKNFFSNAKDWLHNVGTNIVQGLVNGLEDAWHWVTDKITSLVHSISGFFQNLLGINSPSKVFMEYGGYITQGLAIGIEKGTSVVQPPVQALAASVTRPMAVVAPQTSTAGATAAAGSTSATTIGEVHVHVAGNLDPTNPVQWRKSLKGIRDGIRDVERSYA